MTPRSPLPRPLAPCLALLLAGLASAGGAPQDAPADGGQEPARGGANAAPPRGSELDELVERILTDPTALEGRIVPERGEPLRLSLEAAIQIALANDLSLQQSEHTADVARYDYAGTWGAFDPVLAATASLDDREFEGSSSLSGGNVVEVDTQSFGASFGLPLVTGGDLSVAFDTENQRTNNQFQLVNPSTSDTVSVALTQPLLRGAWSSYATSLQREAELNWIRQVEATRQTRQDLVSRVHEAYWNVAAARDLLGVTQTTLELGVEQLEQNQRRLDAGVGTEVEVLQAEANVAVRIQERLEAVVAVIDAEDVLKQMLFPGTDATDWMRPLTPVTPLPETYPLDAIPTWESALRVALERRSELRQQRTEIAATEVRLDRLRSDRLPALDLSLTGAATGFDGDPENAFDKAVRYEFPALTAALSFSVPIGNRAATNAVRAARVLVRQSLLTYDQLETQITAEVRFAVREVGHQVAAVRAAESSVQLARRQLEAEEARYREGLTTNFQVLEFQESLAQALSSLTAARVGLAKALAGLQRAEGVLGEVEPLP